MSLSNTYVVCIYMYMKYTCSCYKTLLGVHEIHEYMYVVELMHPN